MQGLEIHTHEGLENNIHANYSRIQQLCMNLCTREFTIPYSTVVAIIPMSQAHVCLTHCI